MYSNWNRFWKYCVFKANEYYTELDYVENRRRTIVVIKIVFLFRLLFDGFATSHKSSSGSFPKFSQFCTFQSIQFYWAM